MIVKSILERYPNLCTVAQHKNLHADLHLAAKSVEKDQKGLWEHHEARRFVANELTFWLSVHELGGHSDAMTVGLEGDLKKIVSTLGLEKARQAYWRKLLVSDDKTFLDVRYEIAVTAGAMDFLDQGTVTLEASIGGAKKNSDIKGKHNGQTYRMEVRVVHDDWPPRTDPNLSEQMESVDVPVGYSVSLRFPANQRSADEVCRLIKAVYEASQVKEFNYDQSTTIVGFEFWYDPQLEEFITSDEKCPACTIRLYGKDDIRIVLPPVHTRSMVDPQERGFFDNPNGGVQVFSGDLSDQRTYKDLPLSTRIAQAVQGKARQCEVNFCNIVVLGTPSLMSDHDVDDAFTGPLAATFVRNSDGSFRNGGLIRKPSGMFVPAEDSECKENLVDPYRIISAVWHVKLDSFKPCSRVIRNPNATVPLDEKDAHLLASTLRSA